MMIIMCPEDDIYAKPTKWDRFLDFLSTKGGQRLNVFLYTLALVWFLAHPLVSVTTGEMKCRGMYVDERSFLLNDGAVNPYYTNSNYNVEGVDVYESSSLCDEFHLMNGAGGGSVRCVEKEEGMLLVALSPRQPFGMASSQEAIVIVVGNYFNNDNDDVRQMIQAMLHRLSQEGVWLSRTIIFVLVNEPKVSIEMTIELFLQMYARGELSTTFPDTSICVIRQAIVLDMSVVVSNRDDNEGNVGSRKFSKNVANVGVYIQGRKGLLPNLDFVSVTLEVLRQTTFKPLSMHPYSSLVKIGDDIMDALSLSPTHSAYLVDLIGMVGFMASMALGPYYPHSSFLEYGVDSLTVEVRLPDTSQINENTFYRKNHVMPSRLMFVAAPIERLIRSLSNLNERLHHSVFMYILPSSKKFVSNGEYIVPCILALLCLLFSILHQCFRNNESVFKISEAFQSVGISYSLSLCLDFLFRGASKHEWISYCLLYFGALLTVFQKISWETVSEWRSSTYVLTCVLAIYTHIALALAHYSLALPSILFFSLILAILFPYSRCLVSMHYSLDIATLCIPLLALLLMMSFPPCYIVPLLFQSYTTYIVYVFTPLHLLCTALFISSMYRATKDSKQNLE